MKQTTKKTQAPEVKPEPSCETCRFCSNVTTQFITCRRYPKEEMLSRGYWCGEWSDKQ